jgi:hypothetical protein
MDEIESVLFVAPECFVYRVRPSPVLSQPSPVSHTLSQIPPRQGAQGYKAQDWGSLESFLWKGECKLIGFLNDERTDHTLHVPQGRLRIMEKGTSTPSVCQIRLEDPNSGELFALSPYDMSGKTVESVLDSSRYFVLRVEDQTGSGKKAYLGMVKRFSVSFEATTV